MDNEKTLYCALSSNSKCTRAVLLKDGKVKDRFSITPQEGEVMEEISRFFDWQFSDDSSAPSKIILIGRAEGAHLDIMDALTEDRPELFQQEIPHGPDIERLLSIDERTIRAESAFRRLDLLAYLSFLRHSGTSLAHPWFLLEWALDRAKNRYQHLQEDLREQQDENIPF